MSGTHQGSHFNIISMEPKANPPCLCGNKSLGFHNKDVHCGLPEDQHRICRCRISTPHSTKFHCRQDVHLDGSDDEFLNSDGDDDLPLDKQVDEKLGLESAQKPGLAVGPQ